MPMPMQMPNQQLPQLNERDRQHKMAMEKLIRDCYSKTIVDRNGKPFTETSYQSHIAIQEFSQFPTHPPPANLPADQIGTVKTRVLVVCVKYSGRVLIHKGKYNDGKNVYQIGRTWDMEELKSVTKAGNDGFILSLNKDYYWRSEEGAERIWKFIRILTSSYGGFMGKYPVLKGWSLPELKLNPNPPRKVSSPSMVTGPANGANGANGLNNDIVLQDPTADPQLLRSRSLKSKNMPTPILPPEPAPSLPSSQSRPNDIYKEMDFTANGQLPMKPMKIMESDRPNNSLVSLVSGASTQGSQFKTRSSNNSQAFKAVPYGESQEFVDNFVNVNDDHVPKTPSTHPYLQRSSLPQQRASQHNDTNEELVMNDSQSFIFKSSPEKAMNIHDYSMAQDGASSPLRNYKNDNRTSGKRLDSLEPFETSAALGIKLEEHLENGNLSNTTEIHSFEVPVEKKKTVNANVAISPDFGIEEVENEDSEGEDDRRTSFPSTTGNEKGLGIRNNHQSLDVIGESTTIEGASAIDSSIQEIEAFMDSQLDFHKPDKQNPTRSKSIGGLEQPAPLESFQEEEDLNEVSEELAPPPVVTSSQPFSPPAPGYALDEDESLFHSDDHSDEPGLNLSLTKDDDEPPEPETILEKDPELEEMFDEIGWGIQDSSDVLIKKFSKELRNVKHSNVKELSALDFGGNSMSNDLATSLSEIENLSRIFKKMEIDFKFLSPEINSIESNSKGLQVKSINKKLLYNDLKSILDKVSMSTQDLSSIEQFKDFQQFEHLPVLEELLVELHGALGTIGSNGDSDDLTRMKALKQYQANYEKVTSKFIRHFNDFFRQNFTNSIRELSEKSERVFPSDILSSTKNFLVFSGITYFIKSASPGEFNDFKYFVNALLDGFLENLIIVKMKNINYADSSTISSRLSQSFEKSNMSLRKSRTLRLSAKRDRIIGKFGQSEESPVNSPDILTEGDSKVAAAKSNEIEDPKVVMRIISEAGDIITVIEFFVGSFYHNQMNQPDFAEYITNTSFKSRIEDLQAVRFDKLDVSSYSNDVVSNLNAICGNYINVLIKKVTPTDLSVPLLLLEIDEIIKESQKRNKEFLVYSFLKKLVEKFKGIWNKLIRSQIDLLNKSAIKGKGRVLPVIKNLNQLIYLTENSIQAQSSYIDNIETSEVRLMLNDSYSDLTDAIIHLYMRDDPLLKNNDHDDKEREHRNITIMKNIFFMTQQLEEIRSESTNKMKMKLKSLFKKIQDGYFQRLINKNIGKLVEFIKSHEISSQQGDSKNKKNDKKYLKTLLSNYTSKDISFKAGEIFKKLEKHIISGEDAFEQDLLRDLWVDMESQFVNYFYRLSNIVKAIDRDIEYSMSKQEIHHIFNSIHSTR